MNNPKPKKPVTPEEEIEQLKADIAQREALLADYAKTNSELETQLEEETEIQRLIAKHDIRDEVLVGIIRSMTPEGRAKHVARIARLQEQPTGISRKSGLFGPALAGSAEAGKQLHKDMNPEP